MSKEDAEQAFMVAAVAKSLTAQQANRFFVHQDGDKINLAIGSIGSMTLPGGEPQPISEVSAVYRIDLGFLRELVKVVGTMFPEDEAAGDGS